MHACAHGRHDSKCACLQLPEPLIERAVSLAEFKSPGTKAVVVCFICNHCPFVVNLLGKQPAILWSPKQASSQADLCCVCSSPVQRCPVLQMASCSWRRI